MKPVFEYLDYRDLLKDAYEDRKAELPLYSYRIMAENIGLDASTTFRILHKALHLPARCTPHALEYLGLTGRSAEYFLLLTAYARERRRDVRQDLLEKALALRDVARRRLVDQELSLFRNWWNVATRCYLEVADGQARAEEIAARLVPKVPESEIESTLVLLQELGLVRRMASGKLQLTEGHLTASGEEKTQAVRAFQKQILDLAGESLERFPREARDVSTLTLAVDREGFGEIREILRECRRQIQKRVEETKRPDRVMQLALAFFPVAPAIEAPETIDGI